MFAAIDQSTIPNAGYREANLKHPVPADQAGDPLAQPKKPGAPYLTAPFKHAPTTQDAPIISTDEVIAAFDCARASHNLSAYQRDPELDTQAKAILRRVVADPTKPLAPHENGYTLTGQLVLDASYPQIADCMIGGFDVAQVKDLSESHQIGVAMEPIKVYEQTLYLTIVVGF